MKTWQEKKELPNHQFDQIPASITSKFAFDNNQATQQLVLDLENQIDENGGQISLPLFRVSGTSLDIEKLFEKLKENEKPLGGGNSYEPYPRPLNTQWKTRIG